LGLKFCNWQQKSDVFFLHPSVEQDNKEPWFEFLQQQGIAIKASK
jgi:hypothetical protein